MYSVHRLAVPMEARYVLGVLFSMKIRYDVDMSLALPYFYLSSCKRSGKVLFYRVVFFPSLALSTGVTLHRTLCQRCVVRRGCRSGFRVDDESWKSDRSVNKV